MSGVVSAGANLTPASWQKITVSSLDISGGHDKYPDHLRQLWRTGEYLRRLMDLYQQHPVPLVKRILTEAGFMESHACKTDTPHRTEDTKPFMELMREMGDLS